MLAIVYRGAQRSGSHDAQRSKTALEQVIALSNGNGSDIVAVGCALDVRVWTIRQGHRQQRHRKG